MTAKRYSQLLQDWTDQDFQLRNTRKIRKGSTLLIFEIGDSRRIFFRVFREFRSLLLLSISCSHFASEKMCPDSIDVRSHENWIFSLIGKDIQSLLKPGRPTDSGDVPHFAFFVVFSILTVPTVNLFLKSIWPRHSVFFGCLVLFPYFRDVPACILF